VLCGANMDFVCDTSCVAQIWTMFVTPGHGLVFRSAAASHDTTYA